MSQSNLGSATATFVCTTAVVVATSIAAYLWWRRRHAEGEGLEGGGGGGNACTAPDISVPEALHTLAHGPRDRRALAARALTEILCGEVQVLEEVLDEAKGKHPEYGRRRSDGRSILGEVLHSLREVDMYTEAFLDFLLQCTFFDQEWDETDEWNELALEAATYLRDEEAAEQQLKAAEAAPHVPGIRAKLDALRRRLAGERGAAATLSEALAAPGMLSMNTRVFCPVSGNMKAQMVRCPRCNNVGYCTQAHLEEDAARHSYWCDFPAVADR